MKTKIYKYCLYMIAAMATSGLMAQSANNSTVAFKEIQKNWATDNFTIREIRKKGLQIAPSKIVLLNNPAAIIGKERPTKKKRAN